MIIAKVNQVIRYNGEYYRLKPGIVIPKMPKPLLNSILEDGMAEDLSDKEEKAVTEESEIATDEHKIEEEELNASNFFGKEGNG